jgi:putative ABC sugar transport system, ATPase component
MDVAGLECTKEPVSFQLNRGEVLGFTGVRDSGVEEVRDALIGKRPAYMASLTVDGRAARITAPRDLPALGIAVLTNMLDPESEAHAARNIVMLDGGDNVDDEAIEDTTRILLMLKESETRMSEILHRPVQSTGQRRWQQMQEIASQNARIMILIQPTDGLDIATRERFVRLLEEITGRGVGVLLFTTDERELHQFSDRVIVMSGGAIQEEWDTRSITADHLHAAARRGA